MKNITEILASLGIQIPEDKSKEFDKEFKLNYKTINDWQFQNDEVTRLSGQLETVETKLKAFDGVDIAELQGKIQTLNNDLATQRTQFETERAEDKRISETNEFLAPYKFAAPELKEVFAGKVNSALKDNANEGKNRKEIFDLLTLGEDGKPRTDIFIQEDTNPNPNLLLNIPPAGDVSGQGDNTGIKFNFTGVRPKTNNT